MKLLNLDNLRREAKKLKKASGITHSKALDKIAAGEGYNNWALLMKEQNKFQRDDQKVNYCQPTSETAHLSSYEQPAYVRAIFR
jgi:hypothetical protein